MIPKMMETGILELDKREETQVSGLFNQAKEFLFRCCTKKPPTNLENFTKDPMIHDIDSLLIGEDSLENMNIDRRFSRKKSKKKKIKVKNGYEILPTILT